MAEENPPEEQKEETSVAESVSQEEALSSAEDKESSEAVSGDKSDAETAQPEEVSSSEESGEDQAVEAAPEESSSSLDDTVDTEGTKEVDETVGVLAVSDESKDVSSGNQEEVLFESDEGVGAKKILDVLDQQAQADASSAKETVDDQVPASNESSSEDASLPSNIEQDHQSQGDLPGGSDVSASQDSQKSSIDPEKMISEAMKKLDQILDDIKEEDEKIIKDPLDQPVNDADDVDPI